MQISNASDVVVLGLGLCGDNYNGGPPGEDSTCFTIDESEGIDRPSLQFPGSQMRLFYRLLELNKKLIVFTMNAGPIDLSEIKATGVPIVAAGYGGEFGGQALVDVLTGVVNPAGALVTTMYPEAYAEMTSFRDMSMAPTLPGNPAGRTFRYLDTSVVEPVWRFGMGLSYTNFTMSAETENDDEVTIRVRNAGNTVGDCVVTCFLVANDDDAAVTAEPIQSLFEFTRFESIAPNLTRSVSFALPTGTQGAVCEATGAIRVRVR